jgi:uncharacterized RDD family membrane protein YckC
MVYDFTEPSAEEKSETFSKWRLPTLGDRLAAVIVDFGVLGLLSSLVLAPVTRQIYITRQVGERSDVALLYLLSMFLFVLIGIIYQTFFVWKHGATLGQKAFKIRVVHLWDDVQPNFMTALTRAIFWWLDTVLLGLPHLGVFSNAQRRPMHDRLADTIVVTVGKLNSTQPPQGWWLITGKVGVVLGFIIGSIIFGFELSGRFHQIEALEDWQEDLANVATFDECNEVTEAKENWPEDVSRLSVAMALFSAEAAGSDCLETEAYRSFKNNEELDLAYLTRAFSRNEDADLSDAYLKKVCEVASKESETCIFSQLIESWTDKNWDAATEIFASILPKGRVFVKIWAIKHFERTKNFERELELIDQLGARRALATFLGTHRAVALWGLHHKDEARAALTATMENLESHERISLSSWFCYRELLDSCTALNSTACTSFAEDIDANSEMLAQPATAVTVLRLEECKPEHKIDYAGLIDKVPGPEAAQLITASRYMREKKFEDAVKTLKELTKEDSEKIFSAEAQMRLVQLSNSEQDLSEVMGLWKTMDKSVWEWRRLGRSLFDRFVTLGLNSQAFSLGMQILNSDPADQDLFKNVVVAGYRAGLKQEAWTLLESKAKREPASEDEFPAVEANLKQEFGGLPGKSTKGGGK